MTSNVPSRLLRTWLVIAAIDFLFACTLSIVAYGSTFTRLWQGVASTVLGPAALTAGTSSVLVGLALHLGVALAWSVVFLTLYELSATVRGAITTPGGMLAVAAVYGPLIWTVMSFVVVPTLTGRPGAVSARWWVQAAGHILFVALPIVYMTGRGERTRMQDVLTSEI